jgi:polar amino acid transport system permease protein
MDLEAIAANLPKLLEGVALTLELVALSLAAGAGLALPTALARLSPRRWLSLPARAYMFFFRGTPLLVQIFLVYYGLGQFEAVRQSLLWPVLREPYWCAILAFALNTGAYTAEILRGAIEAVPAGQVEAARAIGMTPALAMRRIVLPQAVRIALPAYGNEVILMLKGSALASTITLLDLTGMARTIIARTYLPVEIFVAAGVFYLALTFLFTRAYRVVERRLARHRPAAH